VSQNSEVNRKLVVALLLPLAALGADWPQWRGPERNGVSLEPVSAWPAAGPRTLWRANVGTGFSSISICDGRVYTMGNSNEQDTVWCFDAGTGRLNWKHTYPAALGPQYYEGGPGSTPTIFSNHVFTISKWGDVFCLDAVKGSVVWQRDLRKEGVQPNRWGFAGSPLVWKNLVILNAGRTGTALDKDTGNIVWLSGTNATGYASPTLFKAAGKEAILIFAAKQLVAVEPETGRELWRVPWETGWDTNNPDPIVRDDSIFVSSYSHGCALIRVKSGGPEIVYQNQELNNHLSSGVLKGDYVYAFHGEAHQACELRCLDLRTGELKWTQKQPGLGSLLLARDKLLVLDEKGQLTLADASPKGFKALAQSQVLGGLCWTPPALANGQLYARNAKGELVCLALR